MFLRFFEELEYAIMAEALDAQLIYDMFAYYALKAAELGESFIDDYNKMDWNTFQVFIKRMKRIENNI